jgi:hypothetical protein
VRQAPSAPRWLSREWQCATIRMPRSARLARLRSARELKASGREGWDAVPSV